MIIGAVNKQRDKKRRTIYMHLSVCVCGVWWGWGWGGGLTDAVLQETVIDSCVLDGDMGAQLFLNVFVKNRKIVCF